MKDERKIQSEIDRMFEDAGLSQDDRDLWRERLSAMGEMFPRTFVDVFRGELDLLRFFTGDLRKRMEAEEVDAEADTLLAAERSYLGTALKDERE